MRQKDRADPAGVPDPFDPPPSSFFGESEPWRDPAPSNGNASLLKVLGLLVATGAVTYGGMMAVQAYWPASASQAHAQLAPSEQNICTAATAEAALPGASGAALLAQHLKTRP